MECLCQNLGNVFFKEFEGPQFRWCMQPSDDIHKLEAKLTVQCAALQYSLKTIKLNIKKSLNREKSKKRMQRCSYALQRSGKNDWSWFNIFYQYRGQNIGGLPTPYFYLIFSLQIETHQYQIFHCLQRVLTYSECKGRIAYRNSNSPPKSLFQFNVKL